jgi:hypothetical protein
VLRWFCRRLHARLEQVTAERDGFASVAAQNLDASMTQLARAEKAEAEAKAVELDLRVAAAECEVLRGRVAMLLTSLENERGAVERSRQIITAL